MKKSIEFIQMNQLLYLPICCTLINIQNQEIIGQCLNENKIMHAEHVLLKKHELLLKYYDTNDLMEHLALFVTLEPCPMCLYLINAYKIKNLVFGAYNIQTGACGGRLMLCNLPFFSVPNVIGGIMENECSAILKEYFHEKVRINS